MPKPHHSLYNALESILPTCSWSDASGAYRYRFSFAEHDKATVIGKENDLKTANDAYDYGARIYDARLGRWMSIEGKRIIRIESGIYTDLEENTRKNHDDRLFDNTGLNENNNIDKTSSSIPGTNK